MWQYQTDNKEVMSSGGFDPVLSTKYTFCCWLLQLDLNFVSPVTRIKLFLVLDFYDMFVVMFVVMFGFLDLQA